MQNNKHFNTMLVKIMWIELDRFWKLICTYWKASQEYVKYIQQERAASKFSSNTSVSGSEQWGRFRPVDINDAMLQKVGWTKMDVNFRRLVTMEEQWRLNKWEFSKHIWIIPSHKCECVWQTMVSIRLEAMKSNRMYATAPFPYEAAADFKFCSACRKSLDNNKFPNLLWMNSFK